MVVDAVFVNDELAVLDLDPDGAEVGRPGLRQDGTAVVGGRANLERQLVHDDALALGVDLGVLAAVPAAEEAIAAAAADPRRLVRVLAADDAVVLLERRVHAPDVQAVHLFRLFDRHVRDVDVDRHGGRRGG